MSGKVRAFFKRNKRVIKGVAGAVVVSGVVAAHGLARNMCVNYNEAVFARTKQLSSLKVESAGAWAKAGTKFSSPKKHFPFAFTRENIWAMNEISSLARTLAEDEKARAVSDDHINRVAKTISGNAKPALMDPEGWLHYLKQEIDHGNQDFRAHREGIYAIMDAWIHLPERERSDVLRVANSL